MTIAESNLEYILDCIKYDNVAAFSQAFKNSFNFEVEYFIKQSIKCKAHNILNFILTNNTTVIHPSSLNEILYYVSSKSNLFLAELAANHKDIPKNHDFSFCVLRTARYGKSKLLAFFLEKTISDKRNKLNTALYYSIKNNNFKCLNLILEHKQTIPEYDNNQALKTAIQFNNIKAIDKLTQIHSVYSTFADSFTKKDFYYLDYQSVSDNIKKRKITNILHSF